MSFTLPVYTFFAGTDTAKLQQQDTLYNPLAQPSIPPAPRASKRRPFIDPPSSAQSARLFKRQSTTAGLRGLLSNTRLDSVPSAAPAQGKASHNTLM